MGIIDIFTFKKLYPLLWRKIDILCHGLYDDEQGVARHFYFCQNPQDTQRTGNAGLQIKIGDDKFPLNVAVFKKFCKNSPYILYNEKGTLYIKDRRDLFSCPVYCSDVAPWWYSKCVDKMNDICVGDLVLLEGDSTAITSITEGCSYFNLSAPCGFCAIGVDLADESEMLQRDAMLLNALKIVATDENIMNFHLTGGTFNSDDRGARNYTQFVKVIRNVRPDANVAVEISPPCRKAQQYTFESLKNAGVDSLTMNIEFWNDNIRKEVMPMKGIISKEEYINAYKVALQVFGENKVTCGFIVGIENLSDTKEGIAYLSSLGVITEVYPFKPNDGSIMESFPITDSNEMISISLFANEYMRMNRISPNLCSGCVKCGACGITQQLINL